MDVVYLNDYELSGFQEFIILQYEVEVYECSQMIQMILPLFIYKAKTEEMKNLCRALTRLGISRILLEKEADL